jgi:hypothetical protein
VEVLADLRALSRWLFRAILHAIDTGPPGVRVRVRVAALGDHAQLTVEPTGRLLDATLVAGQG